MELDDGGADERLLRSFLDGLPREPVARDAAVGRFLAESLPPARLLTRAATWTATDGPRFSRDALRAVAATKAGAAALTRALDTLLAGAAHGAAAVRKETALTIATAATAAADPAPLCAGAAAAVGGLALDDDAGAVPARW